MRECLNAPTARMEASWAQTLRLGNVERDKGGRRVSDHMLLGRARMRWWLFWLLAVACARVPTESPTHQDDGAHEVGVDVCRICHPAQTAEFERTVHARLSDRERTTSFGMCETCHGPGSRHVATNGSVQALRPMTSSSCTGCHDERPLFEWGGSAHDLANVGCTTCHNPMTASPKLLRASEPEICFSCHTDKRAQALYPSHHPIEERKVGCSDCHSPHGSIAGAMVRADSTNELCAKCHPEKDGPFLFEHPPASEDCALCHEPHGTIADNLLRETEPFLCLGCHAGHQGPLPPLVDIIDVSEKRASFYTRCSQCHETVHGTDLPSTSGHGRFTR